jgi:hypothetical protein
MEIQQDPQASASDKDKAKRASARAEQLEGDIKRRLLVGGTKPTPRPGPSTPAAEKPKREPSPFQQIWIHDASPGSVASGMTYQYRMRVRILNGLVGFPERFRDPADGTKVFIEGPWSTPVEIRVPPASEFYFTSDDQRNQQVSAELYQWADGVWTKARKAYGIGDKLAYRTRADLPDPDRPGEIYRPEIDFEVEGAVIDIDFQRPYRERKRGATKTGVKFGAAATDCCVVFVDSSGRLHERFVPTDKGHPGRAEADARTQQWRSTGKKG